MPPCGCGICGICGICGGCDRGAACAACAACGICDMGDDTGDVGDTAPNSSVSRPQSIYSVSAKMLRKFAGKLLPRCGSCGCVGCGCGACGMAVAPPSGCERLAPLRSTVGSGKGCDRGAAARGREE